jgi:hypothetical protein
LVKHAVEMNSGGMIYSNIYGGDTPTEGRHGDRKACFFFFFSREEKYANTLQRFAWIEQKFTDSSLIFSFSNVRAAALTTHLHLVQRTIIAGLPPFPDISSWSGA